MCGLGDFLVTLACGKVGYIIENLNVFKEMILFRKKSQQRLHQLQQHQQPQHIQQQLLQAVLTLILFFAQYTR